jgi:hypothetical protein
MEVKIMAMRTACGVLLFLAGVSVASANDAVLDEALARKALPAAEVQGSVRTTTLVTGGDEPETETSIVDPRKRPDKALASYAELKAVIGTGAHVVERQTGRTIYAFTTRHVPRTLARAGNVSIDMDGKDDDEQFDGKAEVSIDATGRPYVSRLDLRLSEPAGNLLAKVKKIDLSYTFGPAAHADAMVATAMSVDVDVRALLFVHRTAHAEAVLMPDAPEASKTPAPSTK